jgi:quercetin dioxygenase-like cupin family protein
MKRLVDAFNALFTDTARSGDKLAETAGFTLANVDWAADLVTQEPRSNAVVRRHLEEACASIGQQTQAAHAITQAVLPVVEELNWWMRPLGQEDEADLVTFSHNFTAVRVIGARGLLPSDKVTAGLSLQAPGIFYPPHAHHAEESYWIIAGDGEWKVDAAPWFPVRSGDSVYHQSNAVHAMQTSAKPLLTVWLWTSHLDSQVVIVRPAS